KHGARPQRDAWPVGLDARPGDPLQHVGVGQRLRRRGLEEVHNYEHHTYTNIVGKDRDLGYTLLRLDPDQPWKPFHLAQPLYNVLLALAFQWGVALYDLELDEARKGRKPWRRVVSDVRRLARKSTHQL